ncbi:hypothetical protein BLNAU_13549 [Blattamonas nauphoetae]|uniref:Uncharacterized protein n=1 Tax=Blattamonas nauphoetae TaxID=2049346 RepID=A0ABQ9XJF5_9EUKA|nr:hypothetical protein BLNAU_13549 [Blattamonas nauphoetae]
MEGSHGDGVIEVSTAQSRTEIYNCVFESSGVANGTGTITHSTLHITLSSSSASSSLDHSTSELCLATQRLCFRTAEGSQHCVGVLALNGDLGQVLLNLGFCRSNKKKTYFDRNSKSGKADNHHLRRSKLRLRRTGLDCDTPSVFAGMQHILQSTQDGNFTLSCARLTYS